MKLAIQLPCCLLLGAISVFAAQKPHVGDPAMPQERPADAPRLRVATGTASCSARACHGNPTPHRDGGGGEYQHWLLRDPHAQAYAVLFDERSQAMARRLGLKQPHEEVRCLACHASPGFAIGLGQGEDKDVERQYGVGCESCHGAAEQWLAPHAHPDWANKSKTEKASLGLISNWDFSGYARNCATCHVGVARAAADVDHDLLAAGHPRLNFEFTVYLANLPQHWSGQVQKKLNTGLEQQAWIVGRLESARAALELVEKRAGPVGNSGRQRFWPELAEYDCAACHHDLTGLPGKAGRPNGRPGVLVWNSWYYSMVGELGRQLSGELGLAQELDQLATLMSEPGKNRAGIATQASQVRKIISGLVLRIEKSPPAANLLRDLLELKLRAEAVTNWEDAEQLYLALRVLNHENLQPGLETLGTLLAFPASKEAGLWDSPRGFHKRQEELRSAFRQLARNLENIVTPASPGGK